jgi:predicted Zn-dependent protease
MKVLMLAVAVVCLAWVAGAAASDALMEALDTELARSFEGLEEAGQAPLYFLQYAAEDHRAHVLTASLGAIEMSAEEASRYLDVDVRVGSPDLDNTHELRGKLSWSGRRRGNVHLPVEDDVKAIRAKLWSETDRQFKQAQERYLEVLMERSVKVAERDTSPDFGPSERRSDLGPRAEVTFDEGYWRGRLRRHSGLVRAEPWVMSSGVTLSASAVTKYLVNSEGTRLRHGRTLLRLAIRLETMAEDGMRLRRYASFDATEWERMPSEAVVDSTLAVLLGELKALRDAPLVEPYTGPAILSGRAGAVYFHEIFGHRIEGHRQKSEKEGQTFARKLGERVLPDFLSVYDDPTLAEWEGTELRGHYLYDDEGVPAQRAVCVENGILRGFLMSRSPIEGFPTSNGHGRRAPGHRTVSRQGNLIIESDRTVSAEELRAMLLSQCREQGKEYGLLFEDISGGFTTTRRSGPQAFKVIPLLVKRVYTDGRPDEVVRGVDIVGTPLTSFAMIAATGDDYGIFNGTCGAESGYVPVSAICPSLLISQIEVEKQAKGHDRPPVLPPPPLEESR